MGLESINTVCHPHHSQHIPIKERGDTIAGMSDQELVSTMSTEQEVSRAVAGVNGEPLTSNQKVAVKFLLSNAAAGVVIGRGGQNRGELQTISGARIQLSRNNQFYPGTTERILLLSGTIKSVLTALYHILIKLSGGDETELDAQKKVSTQLKIIMPAAVCGAIIGKSGATIKSFSLDSGTSISVSPQDKGRGLEYDRIVTIAGGLDQLLRAVALVVTKVAENPNYINNTNLSVGYANGSGAPYRGAPGEAAPFIPAAGAATGGSQQRAEITMSVPDNRVGAVIGKGGETVAGLKKLLGVKVVVSGRDDFEPGTQNRKVKIFGTSETVHIAQLILTQKLQQASFPRRSYGQDEAQKDE